MTGSDERQYWAVAAGKKGDYSEVFLRFGVAFGGNAGEDSTAENNEYVDIYQNQMRENDLVILRKGASGQNNWEILAVGHINGEYKKIESLDDMDGRNRSNCRPVQWKVPPKEEPHSIHGGFKPGTVGPIGDEGIKKAVEELFQTWRVKEPETLPPSQKILGKSEISEKLKGRVDNDKIIFDLQDISRYYDEDSEDVSEEDVKNLIITPLLRTLGWNEKTLRYEFSRPNSGKPDIVFFEGDCRSGENKDPYMILEAKSMRQGLKPAEEEINDYGEKYKNCKKAIVSNGLVFKVFTRKNGGKFELASYLSLLKPREKHPYEKNVEGFMGAIRDMKPPPKP